MSAVYSSRKVRVAAAAAVLGAILAAAPAASATTGVTSQRLAGATRFDTAQSVAAATFPSGHSTVIIASGVNFPDALSASYLAGRLHAPILLTDPTSLPAATLAAIHSLGATGVDIVGGTAAVSAGVQTQLQSDNLQVKRIAGPDRFATAAAVAQVFPASYVGSLSSVGATAIVASGVTFPDALSAGPMAYRSAFPILLTNPTALASSTSAVLKAFGIKQVLVLGGTSAIAPAVSQAITNLGITTTRVAGPDRTATATAIAAVETTKLGFTSTQVTLARGDQFPDALGASPYAGVQMVPVLLTESPTTLGTYTTTYLHDNAATISHIEVLGGTSAITAGTLSAALTAAS